MCPQIGQIVHVPAEAGIIEIKYSYVAVIVIDHIIPVAVVKMDHPEGFAASVQGFQRCQQLRQLLLKQRQRAGDQLLQVTGIVFVKKGIAAVPGCVVL
ncbi:hypothetical protein D3C75_829660 [compost metagenome]